MGVSSGTSGHQIGRICRQVARYKLHPWRYANYDSLIFSRYLEEEGWMLLWWSICRFIVARHAHSSFSLSFFWQTSNQTLRLVSQGIKSFDYKFALPLRQGFFLLIVSFFHGLFDSQFWDYSAYIRFPILCLNEGNKHCWRKNLQQESFLRKITMQYIYVITILSN